MRQELRLCIVAAGILAAAVSSPVAAQRKTAPGAPLPVTVAPAQTSAMRFRYIGPVGNRVTSVAGVPGDFNTYYTGRVFADDGIVVRSHYKGSLVFAAYSEQQGHYFISSIRVQIAGRLIGKYQFGLI